ncbi:MAG: tRNA (N(6)-L-threonylcarbamoyladenosine(37)-C(2))-methylthiotransferase MtaB, partial [Chitinophagaceae bacterium]|nr:tRNA (N(6)-L-threonylcarbamoyladenosine(37)-C(2))-methylthiotransferase MtaB [Chitinophagaceae bacterium]
VHVRHQRNKILRNLSYNKTQHFTERHRGQIRKVLFEAYNKVGMMEGYTDNYIRMEAPYEAEWVNQIVDWKI